MALSIYRIRKWARMFSGKSILHVNQDLGKAFSTNEIKGYYNNLTEKVTRMPLPVGEVPEMELDAGSSKGKRTIFSTAVMQYGLGAYDLYLLTGDRDMLARAVTCADWAVTNQKPCGGWLTFDYYQPQAPYSSMSTGEGISLLARVFKETGNLKYLDSARAAYEFLTLSISEGGVSSKEGDSLVFYEFTNKKPVLNGSIFSFWGLWDYALLTGETEAQALVPMAEKAIADSLCRYDCGYWSMYDEDRHIASPFYHRLHIAQLEAMWKLTGRAEYADTIARWKKYQESKMLKARAVAKKAWQKIRE